MEHHIEDAELEKYLLDIEADNIERKSSLSSDKVKVSQAICAFANDLPGHGKPGILFIGACDDGACAGLTITDDLLKELSKMRDDGNIVPFPSMNVEKRIINGCTLAIVTVLPSLAPPIRYKGQVWIRVGPRRAIATPEEERRLTERRRSRDLPFDLQPVPSATINDLDLTLFSEEYLPQAIDRDTLKQNHRSTEEQLKALRFLDKDGTPTYLGVIVLGIEPRNFVPCDYVQFLRIDGNTLTDPIRDQEEIDGPLSNLLRRLDEKLIAHNTIASSITSHSIEIKHPKYPIVALQQLTRNAILHRTYEATNAPVRVYWFDDRIEIYNPGGLYGQVTQDNFGQQGCTDYRNPHIAEAMKNLGYVQRFGFGIPIARSELEKNGNPQMEFEFKPENTLVTIRGRL